MSVQVYRAVSTRPQSEPRLAQTVSASSRHFPYFPCSPSQSHQSAVTAVSTCLHSREQSSSSFVKALKREVVYRKGNIDLWLLWDEQCGVILCRRLDTQQHQPGHQSHFHLHHRQCLLLQLQCPRHFPSLFSDTVLLILRYIMLILLSQQSVRQDPSSGESFSLCGKIRSVDNSSSRSTQPRSGIEVKEWKCWW